MRGHFKYLAAVSAVALVATVGAAPAHGTVIHVGDCAPGVRAIAKLTPGLVSTKALNTEAIKGMQSDLNDDTVADGSMGIAPLLASLALVRTRSPVFPARSLERWRVLRVFRRIRRT